MPVYAIDGFGRLGNGRYEFYVRVDSAAQTLVLDGGKDEHPLFKVGDGGQLVHAGFIAYLLSK
jgi:hypothetical protein